MKQVILLIALLPIFFVSCKKDVTLTSYQIFNNSTAVSSTTPYLDGSMYEVVVYCYVGTDIVRQDNIVAIKTGEKSIIKEVPSTYTKIKVSFKLLPPASAYYDLSFNSRYYTVTYTLLESEKNTISEINGHSMLSTSMNAPSKLNSKEMSKISLLK